VSLPIATVYLGLRQRAGRMGRRRKAPSGIDVGPKSNEHHTVPPLRHAIIRRVKNLMHDAIFRRTFPRMLSLKARQMVRPFFTFVLRKGRVLKLQQDVSEVVSERPARQTTHVLENECFGSCFAHCPNGFRPHVPMIGVGAMFAAKAEWLTRRPACYDIDPGMGAKIKRADIALCRGRPVIVDSIAVLSQGFTAPPVAFNNQRRLEARAAHADPKAPGSCKEFDGAQ
jgi:hypothetical protein